MGNTNQHKLDIACLQGDLYTVKRILEHPSNNNLSLMSPVWNACRSGSLEIVKYLFQDEYKHRLKDEIIIGKGFFNACTGRHLEVARFLLEQDGGRVLKARYAYRFTGCFVAVDLLVKNEEDRKVAIAAAWDKSKYDIVGYLSDKKF